ncbi:MAG: S41 family peptidase [Planctomycetota bacterium]|jgi:carboxyl-terminal processing protease
MTRSSLLVFRRYFVFCLAASVCFLAFSLPASNGSAQETSGPFDAAGELQRVWDLVNERFYRADFNGVDWPAARETYLPRAQAAKSWEELSPVINEMLGLLRTSHTNYYTAVEPEYYFLYGIFSTGPLAEVAQRRFPEGKVQFDSLGLFTRRVDGKWFVSGVLDGSPAAAAGIHRGNEIVSLNGQPFQPVRPLQGLAAKGESVRLEVQVTAEPNSRRTLELKPVTLYPNDAMLAGMEQSMRVIDHRGKKIAYVHVWSYAGKQYYERLVKELLQGSFDQADALVLDIRDGWGGASPEYLNIFNQRVPQLTSFGRDQQESFYKTQWRKPVALLTNGGSRSGKEVLAYGFRKYGIGPVVGERTGGAVSAGTAIPISENSLLYLCVSGVRVDGEVLEGVGVAPDHEVIWPLPYASAEDPQLQKALDLMAEAAAK